MVSYINQEHFLQKLCDSLENNKLASEVYSKKQIKKIIKCLNKKTVKHEIYRKKFKCDPTKTVLLLNQSHRNVSVVPKEDYFQTLYEAHILSGHSGAETMIKQLKLYCCIPDFVVHLFVDSCVVCLEAKREKFLSLINSKVCSCVDRGEFLEKFSEFLEEKTEIGFKTIARQDLDYLLELSRNSESIGDEPLVYKLNEYGILSVFWKFSEDTNVEIVCYEDFYYYLSVAHENTQHGGFLDMKMKLDEKYFVPNRAIQVFLDLSTCQMRESQFPRSQKVPNQLENSFRSQYIENEQIDSRKSQVQEVEDIPYKSPSLFSSPPPSDIFHEGQMLNITSDFDFTPNHHKFSESPDLKLDNPEDLFDVERILEALDTRPDLQLRTPSPQEEIYISSQELRGEAQSQQSNLKTPSDLKFECSEPKTPPRTPVKRKTLKVINPGKEFNDEGEVLIIKLKSSFNIPGILLYRDIATEFTVLRVLTKSSSIEDIAKELWKIFSNFGFPSKLQTEGSKEFTLNLIEELYKLYPGNGVTMNHNPIMRPIYNRKTKDQVRLLINQWIVENLSNDLEMACHKVQWMINTSTVDSGPCPLYGVFLGKVGFVHENPEQDSFFRAVGYTSKRLSRNSFVDSDSDRSSDD